METLIVAIIVAVLLGVGTIMLMLGKRTKESDSYIQARHNINNANVVYTD